MPGISTIPSQGSLQSVHFGSLFELLSNSLEPCCFDELHLWARQIGSGKCHIAAEDADNRTDGTGAAAGVEVMKGERDIGRA